MGCQSANETLKVIFHLFIQLTHELDVVIHVFELELRPLHHHLLPHLVLNEVAPLHTDGELGDPAERTVGSKVGRK